MRTGRSVKDGSSNFDEAVALPLIVQHIKLCQCLCSNGVRKAQRALLSAVWFSPARGARKNPGGAKLLVSGGPTNCFRLLSTTCAQTSLMSSYSLQWNALSSTNTWLLHNPVSPDKQKISGHKLLHTQLYGQDTKILIFKPRQTSYSKCAVG